MMPFRLFVFALLALPLSHSCADDSPVEFSSQKAKRARIAFTAAAERERERYETELRKLRIAYSADLEAALKASTGAGDFEEAQRIHAEKKRVDALLEAKPDESEKAVIERLNSRTWYRFTPGEPTLSARFLPNGTLKTLNRSSSFTRWSYRDGVLSLGNGKGDGIDFILVHDDVFAPPKGSPYKHIWASPQ